MIFDVDLSKGCPDCGSLHFHPGPRGAAALNVMCAGCKHCFNSCGPFGAHRIEPVAGVYRLNILLGVHEMGLDPAVVERTLRAASAVMIFEGQLAGKWVPLAFQKFGGPPATISDNHAKGRDIYVTEVFVDHGTIKKLPLGIDIDHGAFREVSEFEVKHAQIVHRLAPGESAVLRLKTDQSPAPRDVRYRYETKL